MICIIYVFVNIQTGDFVAFKTSALEASPVIKRAAAVGGQVLKLRLMSDGHARVLIDGQPAMAVDGKPYELSARAASVLRLYEGSLPLQTLLVLGRPGTLDSSKIGPIVHSDIVGVVVLPEAQAEAMLTRP